MLKKNLLILTLIYSMPLFSAFAAPHEATGCDAKRLEIQKQIDYANAHGNNHRLSGLQKALSELNANCTPEGLRAEREAKVREKTQKVEERRRELNEVKNDGQTDKIMKKKQKLTEAEAELNEAKAELKK
ncbi:MULTISPECIES: DUF1090 domain-containing protein [Serratia]|uniref:DUF1090 domain-containing protein n=1 Tax=Serratia TaxID=613 RepID=UPI0008AA22A8|nr:DUF1090 domain-containing protein [Serratia marcescens]APS37039.1 hypothetical protein RN42_25875 [Serratia marcescens]OHT35977.1 hypothetical protein BGV45_25185 [Serratia marcescens]OHT38034.1 hypothetical protein BGV46_25190 [Serratia marcescens]